MAAATPVDLETPPAGANALLDILERVLHASRSEWLFLRELRVGTGFRNSSSQRLDAFALNCLPHTAMRRVCYEVKMSRADFLCELRHPLKRRIGMRFSNEFFFVTPPGLLKTAEIPVECGLIEIDLARQDYVSVAVPAPWRDTPGPTWQFAAAMLRNQRRQWDPLPSHIADQGRLTFE